RAFRSAADYSSLTRAPTKAPPLHRSPDRECGILTNRRRHTRIAHTGARTMKTLKEMLAEARQVIPEQGPQDLKRRLDAHEPLVLVDVRDPDEYRDGAIEPAANISRGFLEFRIGTAAPDPQMPFVLYSQTGLRSMLGA